MTFKMFKDWCNERACDGCWSMETAMVCLSIMGKYNKVMSGWRREKKWKKSEDKVLAEQIVEQINQKIDNFYGGRK